ncbi:hypothetical protein [Streptacidiphilus albus]|uniref:hypothetical protein n=1 Tax=Streptacidiphilus albus TaxID=105425 RepID=UPI00054BE49B|nr:hypothetical protein [Streptacidiphilus albus]
MPISDATPQEEFSRAAERMAVRALDVLSALGGADATSATAPHRSDGPAAALGGTRAELGGARVLGADLFAPYLLTGTPLHPGLDEARAMVLAFEQYPPAQPEARQPAAAQPGAPQPAVPQAADRAASAVVWRDWAAAEVLGRCGHRVPVPPPDGHEPQDGAADQWQQWSVWMAQLSPLALPGLDSPVHDSARRNPRALGRGAVRAMLRRDYRTAARIARWLSLGQAQGVASPVRLEPLLHHVRLFGGPSARTALDVRVGERLAEAGP